MARSGLRRLTWISIHAPREGCDACPVTWSAAQRRISIHAPREGCDGRRPDRRPSSPDFNPRTPRGVRPNGPAATIRAPNFNPRTPRGVRRWISILLFRGFTISIHAPREGCDFDPRRCRGRTFNFNPRTPRGVRPGAAPVQILFNVQFQSTHPARGATFSGHNAFWYLSISIHAPREGCDRECCALRGLGWGFQSTHPARGATPYGLPDPEALRISIHAPREGCDMVPPCLLCLRVYFNPRTPRGVRRFCMTH